MSNTPVILVTGASSGIGAATARLFAKRGYRVVLAARRFERLQNLADEIAAGGGSALPFAIDLCHQEEIEALVEATLERYGQIDVLFNNAGFGRLNWLENLEAQEDITAQVQVNLLGVMWLARAVLPYMIEHRRGHIINMSSVAGWIAPPTYTVYAATKFAVRGFSEALRRDVGVYGIRVSTIYPSAVATEFGEIAGFSRTTNVTMPDWLLLSAEEVAHGVWSLAQRPRRTLVMPWLMIPAIWANTLLPGVVDWVIERLFVRPERFQKSKKSV